MEWIMDNLATIIVGLLLLTAVIFAIYRLIRNHRNGKCSTH
ncbi:MAG: FeoB-associated Cys-rich membrane protein [Lachnospiraceae bacterium]|nr:FeoB-associated Cys-rich membrane protein [Lachnospiraceae bacterium]